MSDASATPTGTALAADVERARAGAVERLAAKATSGLTLDEYAERAVAVEQAATAEELEAIVAGLPEERSAGPSGRSTRWLVGVLGGTNQHGRWRLSSRLRIVAFFGGANLDLGQAEPEVAESVISVIAVFGGADIVAPPGVPIAFSGISLLGGRSDERPAGPPLPGAPLVRLRVIAILGGVKVKGREPRRDLLAVIRSRLPGGRPRPGAVA